MASKENEEKRMRMRMRMKEKRTKDEMQRDQCKDLNVFNNPTLLQTALKRNMHSKGK